MSKKRKTLETKWFQGFRMVHGTGLEPITYSTTSIIIKNKLLKLSLFILHIYYIINFLYFQMVRQEGLEPNHSAD